MSVTELLPALRELSQADKRQVLEFLQRELAPEDELLQVGRTYEVWSPYDAYGAAETLQAVLNEADDAER